MSVSNLWLISSFSLWAKARGLMLRPYPRHKWTGLIKNIFLRVSSCPQCLRGFSLASNFFYSHNPNNY